MQSTWCNAAFEEHSHAVTQNGSQHWQRCRGHVCISMGDENSKPPVVGKR